MMKIDNILSTLPKLKSLKKDTVKRGNTIKLCNVRETRVAKKLAGLKECTGIRRVAELIKKVLPYLAWIKYINPFHYITRLDRYIIGKFIGT